MSALLGREGAVAARWGSHGMADPRLSAVSETFWNWEEADLEDTEESEEGTALRRKKGIGLATMRQQGYDKC